MLQTETDREPLRLLGSAELAEELGWLRQRVTIYLKRGRLPEPTARLRCGPVWTGDQVDELVRRLGKDQGGGGCGGYQAR